MLNDSTAPFFKKSLFLQTPLSILFHIDHKKGHPLGSEVYVASRQFKTTAYISMSIPDLRVQLTLQGG